MSCDICQIDFSQENVAKILPQTGDSICYDCFQQRKESGVKWEDLAINKAVMKIIQKEDNQLVEVMNKVNWPENAENVNDKEISDSRLIEEIMRALITKDQDYQKWMRVMKRMQKYKQKLNTTLQVVSSGTGWFGKVAFVIYSSKKIIAALGKLSELRHIFKCGFIKSIASKSTWIVSSVIAAVQIGGHFVSYMKGEIDGHTFFKLSMIKAVSTAVSAAAFALGCALFAVILVNPVGIAIAGGVVGGLVGFGVQRLLNGIFVKEVQLKETEIRSASEIYIASLGKFDLTESHTEDQLHRATRQAFLRTHPDKHLDKSEEQQAIMRQKFTSYVAAKEIINAWKQNKH